jgi:hypothetical protein
MGVLTSGGITVKQEIYLHLKCFQLKIPSFFYRKFLNNTCCVFSGSGSDPAWSQADPPATAQRLRDQDEHTLCLYFDIYLKNILSFHKPWMDISLGISSINEHTHQA